MQVGINPYLHCFLFESLSGMYGAFFVFFPALGFVDSVYSVFMPLQTLQPVIYCFNVQLIYRLRTCLFVLQKKQRIGKTRYKDCVHNRETRLKRLC